MSEKTISAETLKRTYDIGFNGFIPNECPDISKNKCFADIVKLMENYDRDIISFRKRIQELPIIPTEQLEKSSDDVLKRLYSVLSIMTNVFVHGDNSNIKNIPNQISIPLIWICKKFGLPPILTHASVDLFNIKRLSCDPSEIEIWVNITGEESERWFYAIMIAIEKVGAGILDSLIKYSIGEISITTVLTTIYSNLTHINKILKRMYELNDPHTFFNVLRIYLGSINNISFDGTDYVNRSYKGGSAAQSSLIQTIDAFLGVTHSTQTSEFLTEMQKYMPKKHLEFIKYASEHCIDLKKIHDEKNDEKNIELRNKCIDELTKFRSSHLAMANRYIVRFGSKVGTGETELQKFLNKTIRDTIDSKNNKEFFKEHRMLITSLGTLICAVIVWWLWRGLF